MSAFCIGEQVIAAMSATDFVGVGKAAILATFSESRSSANGRLERCNFVEDMAWPDFLRAAGLAGVCGALPGDDKSPNV